MYVAMELIPLDPQPDAPAARRSHGGSGGKSNAMQAMEREQKDKQKVAGRAARRMEDGPRWDSPSAMLRHKAKQIRDRSPLT